MKSLLRWLAFFVIGDLLMAAIAVIGGGLFGLIIMFLGAVWESHFNLQIGVDLFTYRVEQAPSILGLLILSLFLPGLFGPFGLARRSLDRDGWRFWRWRRDAS